MVALAVNWPTSWIPPVNKQKYTGDTPLQKNPRRGNHDILFSEYAKSV